YVEVRMGEGGDSDDEILDDGSAVLDVAEHSMREAGLALPLQTGCALVAAKILSDDTEQAARERSQIVEIANNLAREVAQPPDAAVCDETVTLTPIQHGSQTACALLTPSVGGGLEGIDGKAVGERLDGGRQRRQGRQ